MGGVIRFERFIASSAVITSLVKLGYLRPGARHRATAIQRAIERLRTDLMRDGVISGGDLSGFQNGQDHPVAKDDLATG
jgi:hypothetical protein